MKKDEETSTIQLKIRTIMWLKTLLKHGETYDELIWKLSKGVKS